MKEASIRRSDTTQIRECCEKTLPSLRCLEILAGLIGALGTPGAFNDWSVDGHCPAPDR